MTAVTGVTGVIAALLLLGGGWAVFRSPRQRGRLLGLAGVALAGVTVLLVAAPDPASAVTVGALSAGTLTGLLVVARILEASARRRHGQELDLQRDPLRWG